MASTLREALKHAAITGTDVTIEGPDAADIVMLLEHCDAIIDTYKDTTLNYGDRQRALRNALIEFDKKHPKK